VVIEDLGTRDQRILCMHTEEVATLAVQHDGLLIASACGPSPSTEDLGQICLWNVESGICVQSLLYHVGEIGALAFSADDRLLVSVGNFSDCTIAVWEVESGTMLAAAQAETPVNQIDWDRAASNEFATVGQDATISFWLFDESGPSPMLNVHAAPVPDELLEGHFTSLAYTNESTLLVGDSTGTISTWDTRQNACIASWPVASTEVVRIASENRKIVTGGTRSVKLWSFDEADPSSDSMVLNDEIFLDGVVTAMCFDTIMVRQLRHHFDSISPSRTALLHPRLAI
jgi:WD40 repeat protein